MLKHRTTFIIGAGASDEFGLPIGMGLKTGIAKDLDLRFDDWGEKLVSGDKLIANALRTVADRKKLNFNQMLDAAQRTSASMPLAGSIDSYLHTHEDDELTKICGKLAIVKNIVEAEKQSKLYFDGHQRKEPSFHNLQKTWIGELFKILANNITKNHVDKFFHNCRFIIFNYDRCVEHFFFHALQTYYMIPQDEAGEIVKSANIWHPYGTVGELPWLSHQRGLKFGANIGINDLVDAQGNILTYMERIDESSDFDQMRSIFHTSHLVVFLGFSFLSQNIRMLVSEKNSQIKRALATGFGLSTENCEEIQSTMKEYMENNNYHSFQIRPDLPCHNLISDYQRVVQAE